MHLFLQWKGIRKRELHLDYINPYIYKKNASQHFSLHLTHPIFTHLHGTSPSASASPAFIYFSIRFLPLRAQLLEMPGLMLDWFLAGWLACVRRPYKPRLLKIEYTFDKGKIGSQAGKQAERQSF